MASTEDQTTSSEDDSEWPHPDDGICQKLTCNPCQYRIVKVTCKFFQGEYRKMLRTQFNGVNMCEDTNCKICSYEHPEQMTCPGCNSNSSGKTRTGLLALEVGQIHTIPEHMTMNGNIKPCSCIVHMKFYIICSAECHKKSIFKETQNQGTFTYGQSPNGGPEIPTSGPVCTTRNYAGKDVVSSTPKQLGSTTAPSSSSSSSASSSSTVLPSSSSAPAGSSNPEGKKCAVCRKEAENKCSRCKTTWYCSVPCQKKDWTTHKNGCVPASK